MSYRLILSSKEEVFQLSIGDSIGYQPPDTWVGVVKLNYAAGWVDIDTRYRWTRDERLAVAGLARRAWMWIRWGHGPRR